MTYFLFKTMSCKRTNAFSPSDLKPDLILQLLLRVLLLDMSVCASGFTQLQLMRTRLSLEGEMALESKTHSERQFDWT